jgi:hypothetical protein
MFPGEYVVIPLLPKTPCTSHKNVHEERVIKSLLGDVKPLMHIVVVSPNNTKREPPTSC